MQSVMNYDMSAAPTMTAPRASFDRSHGYKTTIDFDSIYPVYYDEVYPGDTFTLNASAFGRLATPLHPVMDNMFIDIHFYYVPMRQLWVNSRKFFGEQVDPGDSIDYTIPTIAATTSTGYGELSLPDYFGVPTKIPDYTWNALYARAYVHIYNEWYRDQNLIDSVTFSTADGPDTTTDLTIQKRGKRHDYFTGGLVSPQKNVDGAISMPLGTKAPVTGILKNDQTYNMSAAGTLYETGGSASTSLGANEGVNWSSAAATLYLAEDPDNAGYPGVFADLSNAAGATILQLRQSMAIQALLELDARAGTRYNEIVYSVYGVDMVDMTYKPEFLGGNSSPIGVQQVPSTYDDDTNNTKGTLGAFGTVSMNGGGFTKSFTEHGVVIGLCSARADLTYQQGLDKLMKRSTRYDYLYPILQNIGDQATTVDEIYCQDPATDTGSTGTPDNQRVFNYQERYAELKFKQSRITGLFRSNCTASLESWHLSEEFGSLPSFNQTFIEQATPMDRAIVTQSEPHLILDMYFSLQCARPMQMYSIPGMGTRF
ncbi:major capsid protein [Microviridae sp.]|nr:major capsid protein [Microviridae sp.]